MVSQKSTPTEEKFSALMKRVRKIGLNSLSSEEGATSPAQMAIIDWIAQNPGSGVQEIAIGLRLTPPTISIGVKKMENNGIVERKPNLKDARSIQFFLTQYGQELYEKIQEHHIVKIKKILSGLSQMDQEKLNELLERALDSAETNETWE